MPFPYETVIGVCQAENPNFVRSMTVQQAAKKAEERRKRVIMQLDMTESIGMYCMEIKTRQQTQEEDPDGYMREVTIECTYQFDLPNADLRDSIVDAYRNATHVELKGGRYLAILKYYN